MRTSRCYSATLSGDRPRQNFVRTARGDYGIGGRGVSLAVAPCQGRVVVLGGKGASQSSPSARSELGGGLRLGATAWRWSAPAQTASSVHRATMRRKCMHAPVAWQACVGVADARCETL
jgi:hypothetical protein